MGITELDSLLLEITCKTLEIIRAWLLVVAKAKEALKIKITAKSKKPLAAFEVKRYVLLKHWTDRVPVQ